MQKPALRSHLDAKQLLPEEEIVAVLQCSGCVKLDVRAVARAAVVEREPARRRHRNAAMGPGHVNIQREVDLAILATDLHCLVTGTVN
jgi:hypothetical protein